jgi:hypothetical protein
LAKMNDPWERLKHEPAKAFNRFTQYRDMGPDRSLSKVAAEDSATNIRQLGYWSTKWEWVRRAAAWDDHLDSIKIDTTEAERKQMAERHARMAMLAQSTVVDQLRKLLERVQLPSEDPSHLELAPADLTRLMVASIQVERQARGEPTQITRQVGDAGTAPEDYEKWSPKQFHDELAKMLKLTGKNDAEADILAADILGMPQTKVVQ